MHMTQRRGTTRGRLAFRLGAGIGVATIAASTLLSAPAMASERDDDLLQLLQQIQSTSVPQAEMILQDRAPADAQRRDVPSSPTDSLTVRGADGQVSLRVVGANKAREIGEGMKAYSVDSAEVVPVRKDDGSLQIVSVSEEGDPLQFSYDFDVPSGASLHPIEGGGIVIGQDASDPIAYVAAAWAVDATGASVATEYVIDGTTLTQLIHPTEDTKFPVIADPYVGWTWLTSYTWETSTRVLVEPSLGFRALCAPGAAPCWNTASTWLWNELREVQTVTNRAKLGTSEYNQLWCHAIAVPYKATYNLDTPTPDKGIAGFLASGCN